MHKQIAKNGSTLNKNMTNTDSLILTGLECTSASITSCNSKYIKTNELTGTILDIPITIPGNVYTGTTYYNTATQSLRIYDGVHWYQVLFTQVP